MTGFSCRASQSGLAERSVIEELKMNGKILQHRPAVVAAVVGTGAIAASMVAIVAKLWQRSHKRPRVPITILSGFLGAGKTTLLSRLLKNANGLRIAVLVNDLAEVNVDARLLLGGGQASALAAFSQLENGCLCCSTETDVIGAVRELLEMGGEIDHLVVECSGMAQPSSLIELFAKAEAEGHSYKTVAMLNQMVTLVDGRTLLKWIEVANRSTLTQFGDEAGSLAELLVEQIECADLIILSKVDCLQQTQISKCRTAIKALNPSAILECASFGDISSTMVFGTRKGCVSSSKKKHFLTHHKYRDHHYHEHGVDGQHVPHVRSFVYKSCRPFQPQRLVVVLRSLRTQFEASSGEQGKKCMGTGILRAKGLVWLATDMEKAREWAQVGETLHLHDGDLWKEEWKSNTDTGWRGGHYGDRRQEIVFIGTSEMQEVDLRNALDHCLLTSGEMESGPSAWEKFPDPIIITPGEPRHKKPTTHGVGCTCCDPDLKLLDQAVSRQIG